jgi:hypothetical protein
LLSDRRVKETQDTCYKCKKTWNKSSTCIGQKDARKELQDAHVPVAHGIKLKTLVSLWVCGLV